MVVLGHERPRHPGGHRAFTIADMERTVEAGIIDLAIGSNRSARARPDVGRGIAPLIDQGRHSAGYGDAEDAGRTRVSRRATSQEAFDFALADLEEL